MNRFDPAQNKPSDAIRSDIDKTRDRMDSTIDALTERLKGRHLVDEVLGFIKSGNGAGTAVKNKVAETTSATAHAVVDAVKAHPLPVFVMGAGLAWLIYEKERKDRSPAQSYAALDPEPQERARTGFPPESGFSDYSPGTSTVGMPLGGSDTNGPNYGAGETSGTETGIKGRIQEKTSQLGDKAAQLGEKARHGLADITHRAAETTAEVRHRTREIASRTRQQVTRAAEEHPLETGFACLALGLLAGLLTPTPQAVRAEIAPMAGRLRQQAREAGGDIVERGKRVVAAASDAARKEAEAQHLTPETMMRGKESSHEAEPKDDPVSKPPQRPTGDWPLQSEAASPPTPAAISAMSGDEQRFVDDIVQPKSPLQPTL